MGLFAKLKLLIKASKPVGQFVNQVKGARAKYKTIPFWLSIVGSLISIAAALQGVIPATTAVIITTSLTAIYNILRGADKINQVGVKPPLQTTEFWMGVGAILSTMFVDMKTAGVDNQVIGIANTVIGAAMAAAQSLAANQPTEVPPQK